MFAVRAIFCGGVAVFRTLLHPCAGRAIAILGEGVLAGARICLTTIRARTRMVFRTGSA